ncbi:histidine phosphatase family protein [Bacillus aerolatus]|uniref:Histidine phosphatase family protein n=1 Tax=Bacillus aerolatus TaxID=2653354 RepID=A0A6I1FHT6_9BACI|nr:histidine phosphatase family protein [Bacillus aerolatus]KAB7705377.1 histidine phosphatase family protein [Bacillus aerolatus]
MDDLVVIGLYRHGITTDNERKAFSGWTNSVLSETGKKELQLIQPLVPSYEKIIASDLQRCVDTAGILFPSSSIDYWPEFREMNFGLWEGKIHQELEHMEEYNAWINDPFSSPLPEGESFQQFGSRIRTAWEKWLDDLAHHQLTRAAVVTHGGVIRCLLTEFAPEQKKFWEWKAENGRGYELTGSLSALRRGERCISLRAVPSTAKSNG